MGRFVPDPKFKTKVEAVGSGLVVGRGQGRVRRRRTTMKDIADQVANEAQRLSDSTPERRRDRGGLHNTRRGQRRKGTDFRRSHGGPTYRSRFRPNVTRSAGRLAILVTNDHPSAGRVEYGTGDGKTGQPTSSGEMHKIPISKRLYREIRKKDRARWATPEAKKYKAAIERGRYWRNRFDELERTQGKIDRRLSAKNREAELRRRQKLLSSRGPYGDPRRRLRYGAEQIAEARHLRDTRGRSSDPASISAFDAKTGGPVMFVRRRKSYTQYAILRRALRNVVRNNFE